MADPYRYVSEGKLVELVKEMVSIPSTMNKEGEMSNWVYERLVNLGLDGVDRLPVEESGDTVIGWLEGSGAGPTMMLNFHMDTFDVFSGWETEPFNPVVKDGKILGLGAHDMKGGGACLLTAVESIIKADVSLKGKLLVSGTSDEENWSRGAHAIIKAGYLKDCKYCLVPEPSTNGTLTIGQRGRHVFHLVFKGRSISAAYGGGINAIEDAAKATTALSNLGKGELGWSDEFEMGGSLCVIGIKGGGTMIYVPELAEVWIDWHILPGQTVEWAADQIRNVVKSSDIRGSFELTWDERPTPAPGSFVVERDSTLVKSVARNLRAETGWDVKHVIARSVADTNHFAVHGGVPTIICGPTGGSTCEANEWVDTASLTPTTRVYISSVMDLLGADSIR